MTNSSSSIVLNLKDSNSYCTFAVIGGRVHQLVSGGIPAEYVLRHANLTGTPENIRAAAEVAFNSNGSEYVATIEDTRRATIYEAGNGLPGFGDKVVAEDEIWQICTPDEDLRISTNGPGKGNSIKATIVLIGGVSDLTDDQWDAAHDGDVVLH